MGIPRIYRKSGERAIASYNYIDIVDGLGFVTFNLTNTQTSALTNYIINNKTLIVSGTTGLIGATTSYDFKTSAFNLPRTVNGTAYLTGFVKNNSITGKVTLSVESGTETGVEGSSIATDATVYSEGGTSYVLKKTITIDDYCHQVN